MPEEVITEQETQDSYFQSIDLSLSEIQTILQTMQEERALEPDISQDIVEIKDSLFAIRDAQSVYQAGVLERLDKILPYYTEPQESTVVDYSKEVKQLSKDVTLSNEIMAVVLFAVCIVAGLLTGKIMWGRIHAS